MARPFLHQWELESFSTDAKYKVTEYPDGTWACSCARWRFCKGVKQPCKHILHIQAVEPKAVHHINGNIYDNSVENIALVKLSENICGKRPKVDRLLAATSNYVLQTRRVIRFED